MFIGFLVLPTKMPQELNFVSFSFCKSLREGYIGLHFHLNVTHVTGKCSLSYIIKYKIFLILFIMKDL